MRFYVLLFCVGLLATLSAHAAPAQELPPLGADDRYLPQITTTPHYIIPAQGVLTSGYGMRWGRMHNGIDIGAPEGSPIIAAASGTVEYAGFSEGGYGNLIEIRHPDGSKTRYAHASRLIAQVGDCVKQGQVIAEVGSTGYSTGTHLHFEIQLPGAGTVNPIAYLPASWLAAHP